MRPQPMPGTYRKRIYICPQSTPIAFARHLYAPTALKGLILTTGHPIQIYIMKYIYVKNVYLMESKLNKLWWILKIPYCFYHFINLFTNLLIFSKYLFNELLRITLNVYLRMNLLLYHINRGFVSPNIFFFFFQLLNRPKNRIF